jgi:hypothetical protein
MILKKYFRLQAMFQLITLGGLEVVCLPLDLRFVGSNLAQNNGLSRVIKIHSTTPLRKEVKPPVPCREINSMLKNHTSIK